MSARVVPDASIAVAIQGSKLDERGIVEHPEFAPRLRAALAALGDAEFAASPNL
jgi:hypothetical protein